MALAETEFQEEVKPAATISGLLVLGAIRQSKTFSDHVTMTATLPDNWRGQEICIAMISADGLYESRNTYRVGTSWSGGVAEIPYPTKYAEHLLGLGKDELAISTRSGHCDATADGALMPVVWRGEDTTKSTIISVYANSFGSDEVIVYVGTDPMADPVDCQRIKKGVRTVFDTVCEIDAAPFIDDEILELEMVRISGGSMSPSEFIELQLGDSL
ncbi:hypothetical protein CSC82_03770 [Rhodobacteraceae bacterium 4F10]|nr:hypothetical protein CSC82_03770 [Rhodobacteraceae bacterium 4F10]